MTDNQEYHDYLNTLAKRKFSEEVTLYFKEGDIESSRTNEHFSMKQIKEMLAQKKIIKIKRKNHD